jgi:hypothetical protein
MHTPHDTTTTAAVAAADASRDPDLAESLGRGHEQRDTYVKPILVFIIVLVVSVVVVQLAVWGLNKLLEHQNAMSDPQKVSSVAQVSVSQSLVGHVPPPEPRLQPSPFHQSFDREDTAKLFKRWDTELSTFGKFSDDKDRVHVPVERMIDAAVEKGIDSVRPKAAGTAGAK